MVFIVIFRYLAGYVRVLFSGDFCERILNLSALHSATLWDIEKLEQGKIAANISVKNFKRIRKIRAKSGIKVKIIKKVGAPFAFKKYSKRLGFAVGVLVFFLMLNFLSSFIWKIEVEGNEKVSEAVILKACDELGIKEGTKIKKIDTARSKEQLLIKLNSLAWASFNIEGCRLTVNVSEIKNNAESETEPSNLLAKVDGVIKHIDVKSGNCIVKVGDAVTKDDVLVSGVFEFSQSGIVKNVKSKAQIIAETKRVFTVTVPKTQIKSLTSENKITKRVLSFFSIEIPLYLGQTKKPYIFKAEEQAVYLFGEKLPLSITKKIFYPTKEIEINLNDEQAKALGTEKIGSTLKNSNFEEFKLVDEKINSNNEELTLTQTYVCKENIVYEVKIEENILQ